MNTWDGLIEEIKEGKAKARKKRSKVNKDIANCLKSFGKLFPNDVENGFTHKISSLLDGLYSAGYREGRCSGIIDMTESYLRIYKEEFGGVPKGIDKITD